jgi:hypothetical protein
MKPIKKHGRILWTSDKVDAGPYYLGNRMEYWVSFGRKDSAVPGSPAQRKAFAQSKAAFETLALYVDAKAEWDVIRKAAKLAAKAARSVKVSDYNTGYEKAVMKKAAGAIERLMEGTTMGLNDLMSGLREAAGDDLGQDPASKAGKRTTGHRRGGGAKETGYSVYGTAQTLQSKEGLAEARMTNSEWFDALGKALRATRTTRNAYGDGVSYRVGKALVDVSMVQGAGIYRVTATNMGPPAKREAWSFPGEGRAPHPDPKEVAKRIKKAHLVESTAFTGEPLSEGTAANRTRRNAEKFAEGLWKRAQVKGWVIVDGNNWYGPFSSKQKAKSRFGKKTEAGFPVQGVVVHAGPGGKNESIDVESILMEGKRSPKAKVNSLHVTVQEMETDPNYRAGKPVKVANYTHNLKAHVKEMKGMREIDQVEWVAHKMGNRTLSNQHFKQVVEMLRALADAMKKNVHESADPLEEAKRREDMSQAEYNALIRAGKRPLKDKIRSFSVSLEYMEQDLRRGDLDMGMHMRNIRATAMEMKGTKEGKALSQLADKLERLSKQGKLTKQVYAKAVKVMRDLLNAMKRQVHESADPLEESMGDSREAFRLLAKSLKREKLPVEHGRARKNVDADEFMFMGPGSSHGKAVWQFKHRDTRNYLWVVTTSGRIIVPKTGKPFQKGFFDVPSKEQDAKLMAWGRSPEGRAAVAAYEKKQRREDVDLDEAKRDPYQMRYASQETMDPKWAEFSNKVYGALRKLTGKVSNLDPKKRHGSRTFGAVIDKAQMSDITRMPFKALKNPTPKLQKVLDLLKSHGFKFKRESTIPGGQYQVWFKGPRGESAEIYNDGKMWGILFSKMMLEDTGIEGLLGSLRESTALTEAASTKDVMGVLSSPKGQKVKGTVLAMAFGEKSGAMKKVLDGMVKKGQLKKSGSGNKASYSLAEMMGGLRGDVLGEAAVKRVEASPDGQGRHLQPEGVSQGQGRQRGSGSA